MRYLPHTQPEVDEMLATIGAKSIDALRRHGYNPELNGDNRLILPVGSIRLHDAAKLMQEQGLRLIEFHEKRPGLADAYLQRLRDGFERSQLQGQQ